MTIDLKHFDDRTHYNILPDTPFHIWKSYKEVELCYANDNGALVNMSGFWAKENMDVRD